MLRVLYVGDPHCRLEDIEDCQTLVDQIVEVADDRGVDQIVFLGDLHHNHAVVRVEVMEFWYKTFMDIQTECILLVGNHDAPGDSSSLAHALMAYKNIPGVTVVDRALVQDNILYLPYFHDLVSFETACRSYPNIGTVICHQTFNGAKYENGFFAKDGVEPSSIPQNRVISGHIHSPSDFDKICYVGSPRWITSNDANSARFLTVFEHAPDGQPVSREDIPSKCRQIVQITDTPELPYDLSLPINTTTKYLVTVEGPASWIKERAPRFSSWAKVRTLRTDHTQGHVRESEGLATAIRRYTALYRASRGTSNETLEKLTNARIRF